MENEIVTMISTKCRGANGTLPEPIDVTIDIDKSGFRRISCPYATLFTQTKTAIDIRNLREISAEGGLKCRAISVGLTEAPFCIQKLPL